MLTVLKRFLDECGLTDPALAVNHYCLSDIVLLQKGELFLATNKHYRTSNFVELHFIEFTFNIILPRDRTKSKQKRGPPHRKRWPKVRIMEEECETCHSCWCGK